MDTRLDDAFAAAPRADFLPRGQRGSAHLDRPLDIGHGATNSQPWTVRYMLARLAPQPGERVLDVGSGSGWTTALLGHLVGPTGRVIGVDIEPALVAMARENLGERWPWVSVTQAAEGVLGRPEDGPFDRILVSAAGHRVPAQLEDQLAPGGRMILPVGHEMVVVERSPEGELSQSPTGERFTFVPLR